MPPWDPLTRPGRRRALLRWAASSVLVLPVATSCFSDESSSAAFGGFAGPRAAGGAFAGFGAVPISGTGAAGSPGSCNPGFCPAVSQGLPCCVSENGPCGADTGSGCAVDSSQTSACSLPPRDETVCPNQALCESACAAVTGPCADADGFADACLSACCQETREAPDPCATCIAGGLRTTLTCSGQCTCDVVFAAAGSTTCRDACAERRFGRCGDDAECGLGPGSCQSLCDVRLCVDPATPSCSCDDTSSCPTGSTCVCGCSTSSFCATAAERERLCAESQGACFGCADIPRPPVVDAGSPRDAATDAMPIDAAIGVTDAGEDGARIPHDADVDATDGSMSRDAGDAG